MPSETQKLDVPVPVGYEKYKRSVQHKSMMRDARYEIDLVFCIDVGAGMAMCIECVKQFVIDFVANLAEFEDRKHGKNSIELFRARIITFGDYATKGNDTVMVTDFFNLSNQIENFKKCVRNIRIFDGEGRRGNGLEALAYAIKSDWAQGWSLRCKRKVIVVYSNSPTCELGNREDYKYYPAGMPRSLDELGAWWEDLDHVHKRLFLFAPDEYGWGDISQNWENTLHIPSVAGCGLAEQSYGEILNAISDSL